MSIADTVVNQILRETPKQKHSDHSIEIERLWGDDKNGENPAIWLTTEDKLADELFVGLPPFQIFQERLPDCGPELSHATPPVIVLGTYHWMASPGTITLYRENLRIYWLSLLNSARRSFPFITAKDAERALQLAVYSTYQHERFHYLCDFNRRLFGSSFDSDLEEALAVAYEWRWLKKSAWNSFYGLMHPKLSRVLTDLSFRHNSPGYRDWWRFADETQFNQAVSDYLHPTAAATFAGTGINFGRWLVNKTIDDGNVGYVEVIS